MSDKTKEAITQLIKTEVKKVLKPLLAESLRPMIKKIVAEVAEEEINKVLAERFISTLSKAPLHEVTTAPAPVSKKSSQKVDDEQEKAKLRQRLLEKLGVAENPAMAAIYEDVELYPSGPMSALGGSPMQLPDGRVIDSDDEGVDLSAFGL